MIQPHAAGRLASGSAWTPRLLPMTATCIAALLLIKSASLVRAAAPAASPSPPSSAPAASPPTSAPVNPAPVIPRATPAAPKPETATPTPVAAAPASVATPPVSDSERTLLLDLRQRRQELETREQALAAREATMAAAERRIGARVDELKQLQSRLEALEAGRRDRDETSWRGLVKVYEAMKPRDAAVIMNDMEMPILLGVIDRMREAKAAAILAAMQPDRARQLTAELAQQRQRANTINRTPPAPGRG
jgi:flagellar motility protein MotE (MotC chaperone)